jgi:hypothetical protein
MFWKTRISTWSCAVMCSAMARAILILNPLGLCYYYTCLIDTSAFKMVRYHLSPEDAHCHRNLARTTLTCQAVKGGHWQFNAHYTSGTSPMKWKYISSLKTQIYTKGFPNASAVTWSLVLQTNEKPWLLTKLKNSKSVMILVVRLPSSPIVTKLANFVIC